MWAEVSVGGLDLLVLEVEAVAEMPAANYCCLVFGVEAVVEEALARSPWPGCRCPSSLGTSRTRRAMATNLRPGTIDFQLSVKSLPQILILEICVVLTYFANLLYDKIFNKQCIAERDKSRYI